MATRNPSPGAPAGSPVSDDLLDSWKEIASFLNRQVRTVQRWEATEGLPIHRRQQSKYGPVYAYKSELEAWWKGRRQSLSKQRQPEPERLSNRNQSTFKLLSPHFAIYAALIVVLVLSILTAKQTFLNRHSTAPSRTVTIAVLPFQSVSDSLEDASAALNLTEAIITDCKRYNAMRVVDQNLVMPFRNNVDNPQQIAQLLHSDKVLSGVASRSRNGNTILITAQLIDSKSGRAVWSRQFEGNTADLLESERQIASSIASDVENVVAEDSRSLP